MTAPASPPKDASRGRAQEVGRSAPAKPPPAQSRSGAQGTSGGPSQAVAALRKALEAPPAGEEDGFQCDHCDGDMAKDDLVCACGATYDEKTGAMDGRPCLNPNCKDADAHATAVELVGGPRFICSVCATVHEQFDDPDASPERKADGLLGWRVVVEEPKAAEPAGRRRRGGTGSTTSPKA